MKFFTNHRRFYCYHYISFARPFPYAYVDAICVIGKSVTCCGGGKEAYTHNFIVVYIFYMPIYIQFSGKSQRRKSEKTHKSL